MSATRIRAWISETPLKDSPELWSHLAVDTPAVTDDFALLALR
jgi:hypothetical protein